MSKTTFEELIEALYVHDEFSFGYDNSDYEFIYGGKVEEDGNIHRYLACSEKGLHEKIHTGETKEDIIRFAEKYKIHGKTIRQIFEEGLNY